MVKFVYDGILDANEFAECYSNKYFTRCNTWLEAYSCLASENIWISKGHNLSETDKLCDDASYVLVRFSKPNSYTEYEYRIM